MFDRATLKDFAPGEGVAAGAFAESFVVDDGWIEVPIPGDVHRALLASGRIENPFYDRNEEKCRWIEDREWWYRMSFHGPHEPLRPDERLCLVFHGLDHVGEEHPDQWGRNPERVFMRKAQFGFGWDWGPRLPTVGIWRPVELRRE